MHVTLLIKQDVHPKVVQKRLGHTSMDSYSHLLPNIQKVAADQSAFKCWEPR